MTRAEEEPAGINQTNVCLSVINSKENPDLCVDWSSCTKHYDKKVPLILVCINSLFFAYFHVFYTWQTVCCTQPDD